MEDKGPGAVVSPGGVVTPEAAQSSHQGSTTAPQVAQPQPTTQPPVPAPPSEQVQSAPPAQNIAPQQPEPTLAWTASEYLHHDKTGKWFVLAFLGAVILAAIVYWTTKDIVSAGIVFAALVGLVVFATRKPGVQDYAVDGSMIRVGGKTYTLHEFKAFSVMADSGVIEISMVPLRRFMPMVTIHVDEAQVDDLVDHLAAYLPMEQRKPDPVDTLLKRLRF